MDTAEFALSQFVRSVARMRLLQKAHKVGDVATDLKTMRKLESEVDANIVEALAYVENITRRAVPSLTPDPIDLPPIPLPVPFDDSLPVPPLLAEVPEFDIPPVPPASAQDWIGAVQPTESPKRGRKRGGQHGGATGE